MKFNIYLHKLIMQRTTCSTITVLKLQQIQLDLTLSSIISIRKILPSELFNKLTFNERKLFSMKEDSMSSMKYILEKYLSTKILEKIVISIKSSGKTIEAYKIEVNYSENNSNNEKDKKIKESTIECLINFIDKISSLKTLPLKRKIYFKFLLSCEKTIFIGTEHNSDVIRFTERYCNYKSDSFFLKISFSVDKEKEIKSIKFMSSTETFYKENILDKNKERVYENKVRVSENKDRVLENKYSLSENKEKVYENKEKVLENKDSLSENKEKVAQKTKFIFDNLYLNKNPEKDSVNIKSNSNLCLNKNKNIEDNTNLNSNSNLNPEIIRKKLGKDKNVFEKKKKNLEKDRKNSEKVNNTTDIPGIRCLCSHNIDYGMMIQCDGCKFWLHTVCCGFFSNKDKRIQKVYKCKNCEKSKPQKLPQENKRANIRKFLYFIFENDSVYFEDLKKLTQFGEKTIKRYVLMLENYKLIQPINKNKEKIILKSKKNDISKKIVSQIFSDNWDFI